jgi:hypothetical protein
VLYASILRGIVIRAQHNKSIRQSMQSLAFKSINRSRYCQGSACDPSPSIAPILTSAAKNTYYTGLSTPITPSRASTQTCGRIDDCTHTGAAGHESRLSVASSSCEVRSAVEAQPQLEPWPEPSPDGCIRLTAALVWTQPFFLTGRPAACRI